LDTAVAPPPANMSRPIHKALVKAGVVTQEYHSGAAESYLCCLKIVACLRCDICLCLQAKNLWDSTYVTAWENKLEFNYPDYLCCCLVSAASRWCGLQ